MTLFTLQGPTQVILIPAPVKVSLRLCVNCNCTNVLLTTNQGSHFGGSRTAGHDPLPTSSDPTGTSQYDNGTTVGASHGLNEPYASRMPGGFDNDDAATTASVRSGVPGQSQSRSSMTGANDPVFTDKPLPPEPTSGTYTSGKPSLYAGYLNLIL